MASSAPSVVEGPWPGCTAVSAGSAATSDPIEPMSIPQSPPGKSVRPTDPANSTSPEKTVPLGRVREMAGRVPGNGEHVEPASQRGSRRSPPSSSTSGVHGRMSMPGGVKRSGCSSSARSAAGAWTGAPVRSASSASPPMWSKCPCVTRIADTAAPDRRERRPDSAADRSDRPRRPPGGGVRPHDVAVRRERAQREALDGRWHDRECTDVPTARRERRRGRLRGCSHGTSWRSRRPAAPSSRRF